MAASGTRSLVFRLGASPTDYSAAVSAVVVTSEESDSDFVSFADAAAGGARDYKLKITMTQDTVSTSLWYYIWSVSGTDVAYEVWPNGRPGSGTPTASQPKFSGSCSIREPDGDLLGGEADPSTTAKFLTEVEWPLTAKPTLAIA